MSNEAKFYDETFEKTEQLPRKMVFKFEEKIVNNLPSVTVTCIDGQVGDPVNDNSFVDDYYRFHDIFHIGFATYLAWSPCIRKMLKLKRKSNYQIDEIEDGARSRIIEEAISMIIFSDAKKNNFYKDSDIKDSLLEQITHLVENREVSSRTKSEWKNCIKDSYFIWSQLVANKGGYVEADMINKKLTFSTSLIIA